MMNCHAIIVSMCVIGSLICNQNDKLHVILTILFLQWIDINVSNIQ